MGKLVRRVELVQKVKKKEAKSLKVQCISFKCFKLFYFPSINLFLYHSVLSLFICICIFVFLPTFSIFLFVYLFICLYICMYICLFCFLSICLYISLSFYLSICLLRLPAVIIKQLNIAEDNGGTVGEHQIYATFPAGRWQL